MITYAPVRKIIKAVSTNRCRRRERSLSLQECLETTKEPRRRRNRWNPWIILFFISLFFVFVYLRRDQSLPRNKEIFVINKVNIDSVYSPVKKIQVRPTENHVETTKSPDDSSKKDILDAVIDAQTKAENLPHCIFKKPRAKVSINKTSVNLTTNNVYPLVKKGGYYRPPDCQSKHKVGIIVPYRYREHNLGIFLFNIHPFLMKQKLEYQIFVIEQYGNELFNKGRLINAGFQEMMKFNTFQCVIVHDLDLLPTDENILYTCPTLPRHMCATVNDTDARRESNITYLYKSIFGGVVSMTVEQFERANGYSNMYFGWGGEDNDMYWRLRGAGYPLVRYNKTIGVYVVLPHIREEANPFRNHLISRAVERFHTDGLSNLEYYVMSTKFRHLCTHIVIEINPRQDNITELYDKWRNSSFYKYK